jgi:hypothetical protein
MPRIASALLALFASMASAAIMGHYYKSEAVKWHAAYDGAVKEIERGQAKALAADMDHAVDVQVAQEQVRDEVSHDLQSQIAAARADAARYAARLRTQAGGGGGAADLPAVAGSAGAADGAGETAEMANAEACATAVVKAEGWQDWWTKVSAIQ